MFRKPWPHQPASAVLGSPPSASPIHISSSPPSPKRQKTTHTPSRSSGPKQTRLSFGAPSSVPKPAAGSVKKSSAKKTKNASILKFFKPVGLKRGGSSADDGLFIAHGGYGLDVSDPEDEEEEEEDDEEMLGLEERDRAVSGELELGRVPSKVVEVKDCTPRPPPEVDEKETNSSPPATPSVEMEDIISSNPPAILPSEDAVSSIPTPTPPPPPPPPPPNMPKLALASLNLNKTSSMLFGKVTTAPKVEQSQEKVDTSVVDEIKDFTQSMRPKEVEDDIISTAQEANDGVSCNPIDDLVHEEEVDYNDDVEDFLDEEAIGFEEREASFGFDPAAKSIEDGFEDFYREFGDTGIVMKPPDEDDIEFTPQEGEAAVGCPLCGLDMSDLSEQEANKHVNGCLDGTAAPTLVVKTEPGTTKEGYFTKPPTSRTSNPHAPLQTNGTQKQSAFAKLMTTNSEAKAWADAAKNEEESRGKRAAERTCPFYKILFNGPITVDAFRYGKIPNCNAYCLSHFHSDHYVGLTARWDHGPIYCSRVTANLVRTKLGVDPKWVYEMPWEEWMTVPGTGGIRVCGLDANHCPGSMLFLFEKAAGGSKKQRILHCGDFRADPKHLKQPLLKAQKLDTVYLDTTYLNPKYAFPPQQTVIFACSEKCRLVQAEIEKPKSNVATRGRLLVVVGTYSIGKERICIGVANALNSKIYAPSTKTRILDCIEDPKLNALLTKNPTQAQVHMTPLMEIRPDTLADYLSKHPAFTHIIGFRPSGWSYKQPGSRSNNPRVEDVLYSPAWKSEYSVTELERSGSTRGNKKGCEVWNVPYSEHSSFRELTMFCCAFEIGKIIPTVNVGSARGRDRMKGWIEKWEKERKKKGMFVLKESRDGGGIW